MSVEGQSTEPNGSNQTDVKELMAEIQQLRSTNERILSESKDYKSKYQEASSTLSTIEKEKLEKEGKTEEILLKEREEKAKLIENLTSLKTKTLRSNIKSALLLHAKDAHDADDLINLKEAAMIEYDEDTLEPVETTVKDFISKVKEVKPHFFGSKKLATVVDGKPAGKPEPKKRTLEDALSGVLKG